MVGGGETAALISRDGSVGWLCWPRFESGSLLCREPCRGRPIGGRGIVRALVRGNDVGLLAEEYDPRGRRQLGSFPQAFSHVALIDSAYKLSATERDKPALQRGSGQSEGS
jgi:GH15 family glucan-1,4-alpha-glucosidase